MTFRFKNTISYDEYVAGIWNKEKAYETANQCRDNEIDRYWKRTGYFWAFITTVYVAFFNIQKEFYTTTIYLKTDQAVTTVTSLTHGTIPLLIFSALGSFLCICWTFSSYGSKHWQENWENHINLLEDYVVGPLYKIYKRRSISVSKVNLAIGWCVSFLSQGLFFFEYIMFLQAQCLLKEVFIAFLFLALLIFCVLMVMLGLYVTGNQKDEVSITFSGMYTLINKTE